jgi:hypothetical protein
MGPKKLPEQRYLRELFDYDPATGIARWRKRPVLHFYGKRWSPRHACNNWNSKFAGKMIRYVSPTTGYIVVTLRPVGPRHLHRLIWKWMTGEDGDRVVHRHAPRTDNRWNNLVDATPQESAQHKGLGSNRQGRLKGASLHQGKYRSRIKIDGKEVCLGYYYTEIEAHLAYCRAARERFGEFWNPG